MIVENAMRVQGDVRGDSECVLDVDVNGNAPIRCSLRAEGHPAVERGARFPTQTRRRFLITV